VSNPRDSWLDRDAGPVVRPYAVTKGRTLPSHGASFGLIDLVTPSSRPPPEGTRLSPEHRRILVVSRRRAVTVVDLAADLDLPVGVIRVLLGDLSDRGLVAIRPARPGSAADVRLLKDVLDGLQAL
jgi:hypothetical protein